MAVLALAACAGRAPAPSAPPAAAASPFPAAAVEDTAFVGRAHRARSFGAADAPATILEITDFSCPTCRQFHEQKADSLKAEWVETGRARLVHIMSPLPQLLRSWHGASAAVCAAGIAGRKAYLAMTRQLYRQQEEWRHQGDPLPALLGFARAAGVPEAEFRACMLENRAAPLILADLRTIAELRAARGLDIRGTPTFVINNREAFYGVAAMSAFAEAIERTAAAGSAP
jgi:protein-disulfide isomerase